MEWTFSIYDGAGFCRWVLRGISLLLTFFSTPAVKSDALCFTGWHSLECHFAISLCVTELRCPHGWLLVAMAENSIWLPIGSTLWNMGTKRSFSQHTRGNTGNLQSLLCSLVGPLLYMIFNCCLVLSAYLLLENFFLWPPTLLRTNWNERTASISSVGDVVFLGRDAINPGAHGRGACLSGWWQQQ